jgi:hypothetical protein
VRGWRGIGDRIAFYLRNYVRILIDITLAIVGFVGVPFASVSWIFAVVGAALVAGSILDAARQIRGSLTFLPYLVPPLVAASLGEKLVATGKAAFVLDPQLNALLDTMPNPILIDPGQYKLPEGIREYAPALFWNKPVRLTTYNEGKVGQRTDLSPFAVERAFPIRLQRTTYFDGLISNELALRKLRSKGPEAVDRIDFSRLVYRDDQLISLADSTLSNHVGGSLMAITADAKLIYQEQGKASEIDPGMLAPSGSGSLDWRDINVVECSGFRFRDAVVAGLERELSEEISARTGYGAAVTRLIGYARGLHRGGKPEYVGFTLLRQSSHELRIRPREDGFVNEIMRYDVASLRYGDVFRAVVGFCDVIARNNAGASLWLAATCLREFLTDEEAATSFLAWFDKT